MILKTRPKVVKKVVTNEVLKLEQNLAKAKKLKEEDTLNGWKHNTKNRLQNK